MATPGALANVKPADLIERIYNGEIPSRIATELGVTKAAVYYHVSEHPEYPKARKTGMAIRLDDAEGNIVDSRDQLSLSRAREAFRAVAWRAEREHPEAWGNAQRLMGADGGPIQVEVVRYSAPVTVDGAVQRVDSGSTDQSKDT